MFICTVHEEVKMNFEFCIPLSRNDLLTKSGVDQYVVDEVFPIRMLPAKLQDFKYAIRTKGALAVLESFDTVFSVLKNIHQVGPHLKEDAWDLVFKSLSSHPNVLVELVDGNPDRDVCQLHRNALKMNCYLLCQFMDFIEDEVCRSTAAATVGAKGRKKSMKQQSDLWDLDWEFERERGIRALLQTLQLKVHRLWDPPVVEEEFTSLVTNICYKLLENPAVAKKQTTRDPLFQIIGTMVRKHNHGLAFTLKTVQLLQHFEHLAATMAHAVQVIATDFGTKTVVVELMQEIGRMDSKDLTKDTSGTRAFATFMIDLAEKIPDLMLPSISVIIGLLDGESYNMRNSVLTILGQIVIQVLSKEGLDEKQRNTRDHFLDKLEDHIHDVHAFTRSKTLQIWTNIVNEKALPLPRQHALLSLVIGRLNDKSSQVRKYAIQLISALLRTNPFAAKLALEELKENYEKESKKLEDMLPSQVKSEPVDDTPRQIDEDWSMIEKDVKEAINCVMQRVEEETDSEEYLSDKDTPDSVRDRIVKLLQQDEHKEAVELYIQAKEAWPEEPPFNAHITAHSDGNQSQPEDDSQAKTILNNLRVLFVGDPMILEVDLEGIVDKVTRSPSKEGQVPDGLVNEVSKQQVLVQYLKDSLDFVSELQRAIPLLCQLLESKNNTDILESMEFFVASYEFGLNDAMMGIRRMLGLVWSKEQGIKDAVVEAYNRLYLQSEKDNPRAWAAAVAKNLTMLTYGATVGDLTSLEELVCQFVKTGDLNRSVMQVLWERFSLKIPGTTPKESRGALILLGMAATADCDIVRSNIDVLVKEGLGERAEEDFILARDTCQVLLKVVQIKPRGEKDPAPFKFTQDHEIFQRLSHLIVSGLTKFEKNHWIPMAEEAVNVLYHLGEKPDVICQEMVFKLVHIIQTHLAKETEPEEVDEEEDAVDSENDFCTMLTRFLSLAGHVALRHLVHLDVSVFGELRRRQRIQEQDKELENSKVVSASAMKKTKQQKSKEPAEPTMEEEMGLTGAMAEDAEAEYIRKITEQHLVSGTTNLLSLLQPIIMQVCNNPGRYPDPRLQSAASLALAKYMTVSSEFCDQHLQLLFTILEKSPHSVIRANAIIALGSITFRFPNLIEPWTAHLYARLRDPSTQVRKNTLMMLTHLILNDMVKVKGQISELASCIMDYDPCIANLAKLFFFELSKKGNSIYNIMPDIISHLSDPEVGVDEENFRTITRYLFTFIQKDKHCENLVEKLCHRFRATRVERQSRDMAFCLSMLSYNDKSMRKLQENQACFIDKLSDEDVYNSFVTIINGARKFAKPEAKAIIDEFEQRMEEAHNKGVEDDEAFTKAQKASSAAKALKGKTPGRKKATRGQVKSRAATKSKLTQDDSDSDAEFTNIKPPPRRRAAQRNKMSFSSDEEDDMGLFEVEQEQKKPGRQQAQEGDEQESDAENADPNVTYSSPSLVKKRHKSVCSKAAATHKTSRTTRRGTRKGVA